MKPITSLHTLLATALLLGIVTDTLHAQEPLPDVGIDSLQMTRNGDYMAVDLWFDLSDLQVESNRAVLLTPRLVHDGDSLDLASVGIYGRRRYYYYRRRDEGLLGGPDGITLRATARPDTLGYRFLFPYEAWMDGSALAICRQDYGCCGDLLSEQRMMLLSEFRSARKDAFAYMPRMAYVRPQAEGEKVRSLHRQAFIDFPVNRTEIREDYRNNFAELAKINATIDSVRLDADVRITSLSIRGHASPEGSYANNVRLARGRTEALKQYVCHLYHFDPSVITTSSEPEDWEGLRRYVEQSALEHKQEILALIASDLEPDAKERRIRTAYPADYRFLLEHCYPALRHSDYEVFYVVRSYSDLDEIRRVMQTQPQKLSLEEFYLLAQSLEPGSDEFNEVFEVAVRMYPTDTVANLNAAFTALSRRDLPRADQYLDKAGHSPQALYARGVRALLGGEPQQAETLLRDAEKAGVEEATEALKQRNAW